MIETEELTKSYGETKAVSNLNLKVLMGEMFGFLGPNGAGKTTTIRMLTTLTKPNSGHAWINGFDVVEKPMLVRKEFGIVQQHLSLDWELTVREVLEWHARLHHLQTGEAGAEIGRVQQIGDLRFGRPQGKGAGRFFPGPGG